MRRFFARAEAAAPPPWPAGDPDVGDTYAGLMQADYSHEDAIDAVLQLAWDSYYKRGGGVGGGGGGGGGGGEGGGGGGQQRRGGQRRR